MREERDFQKRPGRFCLKTTCKVVRESDFSTIAERVENLSSWGMLVSPAASVTTGERVYVSFQLPRTGAWFDAMAVVTRVIHGRRPGDSTRKLGLEFVDLTPFDRYRLAKSLEAAPPVPPNARRGRRDAQFSLAALCF